MVLDWVHAYTGGRDSLACGSHAGVTSHARLAQGASLANTVQASQTHLLASQELFASLAQPKRCFVWVRASHSALCKPIAQPIAAAHVSARLADEGMQASQTHSLIGSVEYISIYSILMLCTTRRRRLCKPRKLTHSQALRQ